MHEPEPRQLDYAEPSRSPRYLIRRITFWIALIFMLAFAIVATPKMFHRWQLVSAERRCLDYISPAGDIIFDERPSSMPMLARSDPSFVRGSFGTNPTVPFVGRVPSEWKNFSNLISTSAAPSVGTAFMHRLRSPSGNERLVVVDLQKSSRGLRVESYVRAFSTGSMREPPIEIKSNNAYFGLAGPNNWTIAAGEIDLKQSDHFTIGIIEAGQRSVIHGYLRDDDSILLEWLHSSSTPSDPPSPASSH